MMFLFIIMGATHGEASASVLRLNRRRADSRLPIGEAASDADYGNDLVDLKSAYLDQA